MTAAPTGSPEKSGISFSGGVAIVGGLLAAVVALLTIAFTLKPSIQPAPPPPEMGATLGDVSLDFNVTRAQYMSALNKSLLNVPLARLSDPGVTVDSTATIKGFKGQATHLTWELLSETGQALPYQDDLLTGEDLTPDASIDSAVAEAWVPIASLARGTYRVRLLLSDAKGVPLAERDSPAFVTKP